MADKDEKATSKLHGLQKYGNYDDHEHDFSSWNVAILADCTHDGSKTRFCRKCAIVETRLIKAYGHNFCRWHSSTKNTKTAERICSRCGLVEEEPFDYEEVNSFLEYEEVNDQEVAKIVEKNPQIFKDYLLTKREKWERIAKEKAEKIAEEEKLNAESERAERNKKITWIVLEIAIFVSFILGVIGVCTVGTVSNVLATIGGIGIIASGIIMRIMGHYE